MAAFKKLLVGYVVRSSTETGDKVTRAMPVSAQVEAGNFKLLRGEWNTDGKMSFIASRLASTMTRWIC